MSRDTGEDEAEGPGDQHAEAAAKERKTPARREGHVQWDRCGDRATKEEEDTEEFREAKPKHSKP